MQKTLTTAVLLALLNAAPAAQWTKVTTRDVPRRADGSVNLDAPAPRMPDGKPDLSGMWMADTVPCEATQLQVFGCSDFILGVPIGAIHVAATGRDDLLTGKPLPYQPWAAARFKENLANNQVNSPEARCLPQTPTIQWADFAPQKIVQTRNEVLLMVEYMMQYRQIFLDDRSLPDDPFPMFKGYSKGMWDGDTLVVETSGFKGDLWLDLAGNPMTDALRLTERIRRPSYGRLDVEITVNDPKAYTSPFTVRRRLTRWVDTDLIEYVCNENEKSLKRMLDSVGK